MADFQNVKITPLGNGNINAHPRYSLEFRICDSVFGQPTKKHPTLNTDLDFTAGKAVVWPDVLKQLSEADRQELIGNVLTWVAYKLNGVTS